jgi:hypothetical protein
VRIGLKKYTNLLKEDVENFGPNFVNNLKNDWDGFVVDGLKKLGF